jgi:hypothetical protein
MNVEIINNKQYVGNGKEHKKSPSPLCDKFMKGDNSVSLGKLYCCSDNSCDENQDNCFSPNKISMCRNSSNIEACIGKNNNICGHNNVAFCLSSITNKLVNPVVNDQKDLQEALQ